MHGVGWGGLIAFNRLRSLIFRFALPEILSNPFLLLCFEQKNILTRWMLPCCTKKISGAGSLVGSGVRIDWETDGLTRQSCFTDRNDLVCAAEKRSVAIPGVTLFIIFQVHELPGVPR